MSPSPRAPPRQCCLRTPDIAGADLTGQVGRSGSPQRCLIPLFRHFCCSQTQYSRYRGTYADTYLSKTPPLKYILYRRVHTVTSRRDLGDLPCPLLTVVREWQLMQAIVGQCGCGCAWGVPNPLHCNRSPSLIQEAPPHRRGLRPKTLPDLLL